jgi:stress response protein YsnF
MSSTGTGVMEADMTQQEHETAVAAFIRARGVTRCPTACAVPTQASVAEADRAALRERAERLEVRREERHRQAALQRFGAAA